MKRTALILAAVAAFATLVFTGCPFFEGIFGGSLPDLVVTNVELQKAADGVSITGVKVSMANLGDGDAENVEYKLVLSADKTMDANADFVYFRGTVTIPGNAQRDVILDGESDIFAWMQENNVDMPADAKYYYGIVIDPNGNLEEENESNNQYASDSNLWWIQGQPFKYSVRLRLSMPAGLTYYKMNDSTSYELLSGVRTVVLSLQPSDANPPDLHPDSNGYVVMPDNYSWESTPGILRWLQVPYDYGVDTASEYFYVGVPSVGTYQLYYMILDENDQMTMQFELNSSGDIISPPYYLVPWGTYPDFMMGNEPDSFTISGDLELPADGNADPEFNPGVMVSVGAA